MQGIALTGRELTQMPEDSESSIDTSQHLTERQVVALYSLPDSLTPEQKHSFERHIAGCSLCSREVGFLKSLESDLKTAQRQADPSHGSAMPSRSGWHGIPSWTYAIAAVIVLCGVFGTIWYARVGDEYSTAVTQLKDIPRNANQLPVVVRELGKPLVLVTVPLPPQSDRSQYVATLYYSTGATAGATVTTRADTSQSLLLVIDTRNIPDGEFDLQVAETMINDLPPAESHFPFLLTTAR
jgi:hypothetical protein